MEEIFARDTNAAIVYTEFDVSPIIWHNSNIYMTIWGSVDERILDEIHCDLFQCRTITPNKKELSFCCRDGDVLLFCKRGEFCKCDVDHLAEVNILKFDMFGIKECVEREKIIDDVSRAVEFVDVIEERVA